MESTSAEGRASEKKSPGINLNRSLSPNDATYSFKDGAGDGKVESSAGDMRMRFADFDDQSTLSRADIDQEFDNPSMEIFGQWLCCVPMLIPVMACMKLISLAGSL